jgi:long-subunit fatty acid transport protein
VRAGWTYLPTPVPDETFMSTLPEGDKNIFAVGMGFGGERHSLDVAYSLNIADDRTVMTPVPGTYEFESHLIGVSYRCAL